jgi:hypothetical protein
VSRRLPSRVSWTLGEVLSGLLYRGNHWLEGLHEMKDGG